MKKTTIFISAILAFTMLIGCTASAAEIFQWIIEPSKTYEYIYYDNNNFYEGYWCVGEDYDSYDIVDSYGNTIQKNATDFYYGDASEWVIGEYTVKTSSDGRYKVCDASGNTIFKTKYKVTGVLNEKLFSVMKEVKESPDDWWGTYYYGAVDKSGNVVIKPEYEYVMDLGYNNWVMCGNEKYGIIDSKGRLVYEIKYEEVNFNDYMVVCLGSPSNNNVIINKATGKITNLKGDAELFYGNYNWPAYNADEFLFDGALVNSNGEVLDKKTQKIKSAFEKLAAGSENYSTIFNAGSYYYIGDDCYTIVIDEYTADERKYCINSNGEVIAENYSYIHAYSPGKYVINNGESTYIINNEGKVVFPAKTGSLGYVSDSFVSIWDYEKDVDKLYDINGNKIGEFKGIWVEGDYLLLKDKNDKVGFAKIITLPDVKKSDKIILLVGEKDTYIYGNYKANDVEPVIRNGRTMIPIRTVAEALGATVSWNADKKEVSIKKGSTSVKVVIGASRAKVNGKELAIDSPAFIENGRTYLPVRFVSEALGASVEWDAKTQAVMIK